jgi:3-hydroxybutyryl-CoA dehydrogenase
MKLVEVISAMDTSQRALAVATEACIDAGKVPIQVKDVVGFAVNRMLFALWNEALRLVEEGACTPEDIDVGCKLGLGHPVGPFELMDLTSNTLNLQVGEILQEAYGERFLPRPILKQIVAAGRAGRKTGRGWYRYDEKGRQKKLQD